jgi:hypothetical protein
MVGANTNTLIKEKESEYLSKLLNFIYVVSPNRSMLVIDSPTAPNK